MFRKHRKSSRRKKEEFYGVKKNLKIADCTGTVTCNMGGVDMVQCSKPQTTMNDCWLIFIVYDGVMSKELRSINLLNYLMNVWRKQGVEDSVAS
jgi:hypothetical protein